MKIGKPLAMAVAIVCCAGCEYSPTMLDRTIAYNRAVASSTNQVLLLNVVRASQRLPTYYTRLEGDAASMALTPNGNISLPLSNPRSFETDINTGATGGITGATTKAIGALAGIVTGLGLQASESNLMTLQTLDDQKYQNGMMTPVPLKNIQAFQDEGYQRDLLFMMFLSSVQVSNELVDTIDAAAVARCGQVLAGSVAGTVAFEQQLCAYIGSGPYQSLFDPGKAHSAAYSFSLRTCQQTGGAVGGGAMSDMVRFSNDPAREGRRQTGSDPHPEICFQILLDDLLVLDLQVGASEDIPASLVDVVTDAMAQDPRFRSEMIQQGFFFRETSAGVSAICKKKNADNGFTLAFTRPGARNAEPSALSALFEQLAAVQARPASEARASSPRPSRAAPAVPASAANSAYPADPVAACQQKNPGIPETAQEELLASSADADAAPKNQALKPLKLTSNRMAFSTRSFQGMIYYLGEAVRYQEDPGADPISFPRVLGRNPAVAGSGYVETMFYSSSHLPDNDAAVVVHDDSGVSYGLPKSCMSAAFNPGMRSVGCSAEYPDNESLQVLNFVNQIWGLQKESVQGPTSPLVVVNPQ
jgi:hypothetical protein